MKKSIFDQALEMLAIATLVLSNLRFRGKQIFKYSFLALEIAICSIFLATADSRWIFSSQIGFLIVAFSLFLDQKQLQIRTKNWIFSLFGWFFVKIVFFGLSILAVIFFQRSSAGAKVVNIAIFFAFFAASFFLKRIFYIFLQNEN